MSSILRPAWGVGLAAGLIALGVGTSATTQSRKLEVKVLSSRPDMISGGDALVQVVSPSGGAPSLKLNGRDVSSSLKPGPMAGTYRALVSGMSVGANTLEAGAGSAKVRLQVTNYPITGPILSGPHMKPYECRTVESGLGPPLDANCSARQKIEYFYRAGDNTFKPLENPTAARPADLVTTRTIDGRTVPYIVRVESGTINRTIYRIAILDDPKPGQPFSPGPGWNGRLAVSFGGGGGTNYNQGVNNSRAPLSDMYLSRGFAHIVDTELVNALHGYLQLQGESLMMVKEHFIEQYGPPKWTVGSGGSGGAIQQLTITQGYPGLLDGINPSIAFPDGALHTPDCGLIETFWRSPEGQKWSQEKKTAIEGFTPGTCQGWDRSFGGMTKADNVPGCGLNDASLVYNRVTNPKGARCTIMEMRANAIGRDPKTGFARKAQDNVGIQYGLQSLNAGKLTVDEFLQFNEKIGGVTLDGAPTKERVNGDIIALRNTYASGMINQGKGGLPLVPIINTRNYTDPQGDVHDRHRDLAIRARLTNGYGRSDNQVIWVAPSAPRGGGSRGGGPGGGGGRGAAAPPATPATNQPAPPDLTSLALDTLTKWLDAIAADPAPLSTDKVVGHKPPEAVDAYWADGRKVAEAATFDGDSGFNRAYPVHSEPRLIAGAPLANDIMKCSLKRIDMRDYKVAFTPTQAARLKAIFPNGVCDWKKPGVGQVAFKGPYERY